MDTILQLIAFVFLAVILAMSLSCTEVTTKVYNDTGPTSAEQTESAVPVEKMVAKINTQVDPAFVYQYEQSKFVPPAGKTLLIMGQDLQTIDEYMDGFSEQPAPGG